MNWIARDLAHNWHPYTQMKDHEAFPPVMITRAKGCRLYDANGQWYYDTLSSWWCNLHGHNHPAVMKALRDQTRHLDHVLFAGFTHEPAILLSEALVRLMPPGIRRVFYSDNGSTAVEVALKLSLQYWVNRGQPEKKQFLSLGGSYHGDTIGTMSISQSAQFHRHFSPLFFPSLTIPSPADAEAVSLAALRHALETSDSTIAAMIVEPLVQAAGGMRFYSTHYLKAAYDLAHHHGVHFIVDEVATGFYRTGHRFAFESAGIPPDFICLSKSLTNGTLPLGATLTTQTVYDAFYGDYAQNKTFFHGHTFCANPLACAAALASIRLLENPDTPQRVRALSDALGLAWVALSDLPWVHNLRQLGLIAALDVKTANGQSFPSAQRIGYQLFKNGLPHQLILRPLGDTMYVFLPLCITPPQIRAIVTKIRHVLRKTLSR
ncbi:MAG: adenosylmethionine--8-amino-7-oxononanoate transaminase [Candidatus Margulisiibacteriota bacterium]